MKIAIIATPRTRSSALLKQIVAENPEMIDLGEAYSSMENMPTVSQEFKRQFRRPWSVQDAKLLVIPRRDLSKQPSYAPSIKNITDNIYKQDNFVVKIMGENLEGNIQDFNLCNCDLIYFIERKNFFDQCCSLEVAWRYDIWNDFDEKKSKGPVLFPGLSTLENKLPTYEYVQNQRFSVSKCPILYQAYNIYNYMLFKKYVIDTKVAFVQKYYESATFNTDLKVKKTNLDYSQIFTNYDKKDLINKVFDNNASYENLYFNIQTFIKDLQSIKFDYDSVESEIRDKLNLNILIKNITGTP